MKQILYILRHTAYLISIAIITYTLITHVTSFVINDQKNFDPRLFNQAYLQFLVALALTTGGVGMLIATMAGEKNTITFKTLSLREKIILILSSAGMAVFFAGSAQLPTLLDKFLFAGLTLFFSFFLPRLVGFYAATNLRDTYAHFHTIKKGLVRVLFVTFAISILLLGAFVVIRIFSNYTSGKIAREAENKTKLYITKVTPEKTTHAENMTLEGYNFKWKTDLRYKVMSHTGEVFTDEWTNEKITLKVPLHLKEGRNEMWIIRPSENDASKLVSSNRIAFMLIDRFKFYPAEDDNKLQRAIKRLKRYTFFNLKFLNFIF